MTNKNNNIGLIVLIAGLVSVPATVTAQSGSRDRPPGGSFIERLDRDGDGRVSQDEFDGPAEHFSDFDQDGDGFLSEDEAPKGPPPGRRQRGQGGQFGQGGQGEQRGQRGQRDGTGGFVERLDRDGDGRVSQDEFDGPAEHFSDFDQDGDGFLSEDEAPKGPPPGRRQRSQRGQGGQGEQRGQGGAGGFVERLDRDGDGRVSQDEFDGPAEHFSDFDQDGDGYLSEDEAPTGPPPGQRGGRRDG